MTSDVQILISELAPDSVPRRRLCITIHTMSRESIKVAVAEKSVNSLNRSNTSLVIFCHHHINEMQQVLELFYESAAPVLPKLIGNTRTRRNCSFVTVIGAFDIAAGIIKVTIGCETQYGLGANLKQSTQHSRSRSKPI